MFSGDAIAVENILRVMCFSRDPKLWNIHVQDLEHDKNLCEEPLPLNRSGETPLEVARLAGHYEEIRQVYEDLGLPTTIKDQCQKRKYIPEPTIISRPGSPECKKRKYNTEPADEFTSRSSSLEDIDFSEFDPDM
jgi:hypothetical protein